MRTYVATYKIYTDYTLGKFFDVMSTSEIKYKFVEEKDYTICYLTLIANNRMHMRKLKRVSLRTLKKFGKVELIIGVG